VIRRLFWLLAGAGLGISGYRRVTRVLRGLAGSPARSRPRQPHRLAGFARDVRDGMDLYAEQQRLNIERRRAPAAPTLGMQQVTAASAASAGYEASRNGSAAPRSQH
jgi:hypothetical protein